MTHDPALARLETGLESIRLDPRTMQRILFNLETHYAPSDAQALARLDRLVRKAQRAQEPWTGRSARQGGPKGQLKGDATAGKEAARQPGL